MRATDPPLTLLTVTAILTAAGACISDAVLDDEQLTGTFDEQLLRARREFDEQVLPKLAASCSSCHETPGGAGPAFLSPSPDSYTRLMGSTLVVPGRPQDSRLLTYGQDAAHPGLRLSSEQVAALTRWIKLEPDRTQGRTNGRRTVAPFSPTTGTNTVELSVVDPSLQGATMTFRAVPVGDPPQGLLLDGLTLTGGATGVHAVHPLFSTHCPAQVAEPLDTFDGIELTVAAAASKAVGGGTVALLSYRQGCRLSVDFEQLGLPGGGLANGCKDVPAFVANLVGPLQTHCVSCHGGANAGATQGLDLRNLHPPAEQPASCGRVKGKVSLADPAASRLLQRVAPGQQTGHPFTLPGANEWNQLRDALGRWLGREQ